MKTSSNRSSDLKSCFPKRKRGERNAGWRDKANSLSNSTVSEFAKFLNAMKTHPERDKDLGG